MHNFFSDLDGRIFNFNLTQFFTTAYLFNTDLANFPFYSWAIVMAVLGIAASILGIWYYKKRRARWNLDLKQRHVVSRHAKISLGIFSAYLVYIISRLLNIPVIGMRFFGYALLFAALLNVVVAGVLARQARPSVVGKDHETTGQVDYSKYLPKKKRK